MILDLSLKEITNRTRKKQGLDPGIEKGLGRGKEKGLDRGIVIIGIDMGRKTSAKDQRTETEVQGLGTESNEGKSQDSVIYFFLPSTISTSFSLTDAKF